ncbi:MAG: hypothetical protein JHC93_05845 [Parachlamydiales bacterium]|nr:hypothetical protein [Parachlamydiales bacterium]
MSSVQSNNFQSPIQVAPHLITEASNKSLNVQFEVTHSLLDTMNTTAKLFNSYQENIESQATRITELESQLCKERFQHKTEVDCLKQLLESRNKQHEIELKSVTNNLEKKNRLIDALMKVKTLIDSYYRGDRNEGFCGIGMDGYYFFFQWFDVINPAIEAELKK